MSKRSRKKREGLAERAPAGSSPAVRPGRLAGAKFRVLAILCLGGGIIGLFLAGSDWYASYRLRTEGIETSGKLVGIGRHINPGEAPTIRATFRYEVLGKNGEAPRAQEATLPISQATYDRWKTDHSVQVRYLPDDPARCSVEDAPPDLGEKLAIGGGSLLVGLVLSYLAFYRWPRKARAQASGPPA